MQPRDATNNYMYNIASKTLHPGSNLYMHQTIDSIHNAININGSQLAKMKKSIPDMSLP